MSNLNLSGCNQSTVCLLGIGKHLDRKVILPFLSARTHISQWNKYVCQGSGPSWQSPGAQEGTVANIDMGPPLGVGAGVLGAPRALGALDLSLVCRSRSPLPERAHALPLGKACGHRDRPSTLLCCEGKRERLIKVSKRGEEAMEEEQGGRRSRGERWQGGLSPACQGAHPTPKGGCARRGRLRCLFPASLQLEPAPGSGAGARV